MKSYLTSGLNLNEPLLRGWGPCLILSEARTLSILTTGEPSRSESEESRSSTRLKSADLPLSMAGWGRLTGVLGFSSILPVVSNTFDLAGEMEFVFN